MSISCVDRPSDLDLLEVFCRGFNNVFGSTSLGDKFVITLSKDQWIGFFKSREAYLEYRKQWAERVQTAKSGEISPTQYLLYNAFRGRDWQVGLTSVSNETKLANGRTKGDTARKTLAQALYLLKHRREQIYGHELLADDACEQLLEILPEKYEAGKPFKEARVAVAA
jgi:hypothetical protein